ncbi:hypothetical protein [Duganella sp. FT27W]|uniref:hypothetical protein n=1 Tax=Duganella sp. FT27W TaxID=2654636 RepID=UPI00128BBA79|nr:hypothetical protein [Duganella sp. FT27W]MPQ60189.1 hypothetical protein [Duganella sp. FT27W]
MANKKSFVKNFSTIGFGIAAFGFVIARYVCLEVGAVILWIGFIFAAAGILTTWHEIFKNKFDK